MPKVLQVRVHQSYPPVQMAQWKLSIKVLEVMLSTLENSKFNACTTGDIFNIDKRATQKNQKVVQDTTKTTKVLRSERN